MLTKDVVCLHNKTVASIQLGTYKWFRECAFPILCRPPITRLGEIPEEHNLTIIWRALFYVRWPICANPPNLAMVYSLRPVNDWGMILPLQGHVKFFVLDSDSALECCQEENVRRKSESWAFTSQIWILLDAKCMKKLKPQHPPLCWNPFVLLIFDDLFL